MIELNQAGVTVLVARPLSDDTYLLLTKKTYKDEEYLDLRKWFMTIDGVYHPTKKGITMHREKYGMAVAEGLMAEMQLL